MKISTLNYFIVDALKSIKRNRTISIAAMITVLMATHAKEIVDSMKKRVLEIEGGEIIRDEKRGMYKDEN